MLLNSLRETSARDHLRASILACDNAPEEPVQELLLLLALHRLRRLPREPS